MKLCHGASVMLLTLGVTGTFSNLISIQPRVPVNPQHTDQEWEDIFNAQTIVPERCVGCTPGTIPQSALAGQVREVTDGQGSRIIRGRNARSGQFPWQGHAIMDGGYFCGCSIISESWVLTAAHCVDGYDNFHIRMGSLFARRFDSNRLVRNSRTAIKHENYNPARTENDVAVINLPTSISWRDDVRPILLPSASQAANTFEGADCHLSGWGRFGITTVSLGISDLLQHVELVAISNRECSRTFGSYIRSTNLCTRGFSGTFPVGACGGDSGGALATLIGNRYVQIGIVSFGARSCIGRSPSVYARVTAFCEWISDKTGVQLKD